ncbi:hypothetical protein DSO57_1037105 [Entomophthora muscae]|uniref:Uncharacterized protein n=1 Tax=Entomophthora muscae TaxID=34485 RepID=A0ACC2TAF9_9FUNG|nr:hypothetical protein DSO57_1037105 [Entomophthora muscae]
MGQESTPEPNSQQLASSEGQDLGCSQPINSEPIRKVDANLPGSGFSPTPHGFSRKLLVADNKGLHKVVSYNTGSLGSEITTNNHPPVADAESFPKIPTHDTGRLGSKINKFTNENFPHPAQSPENGAGPEYLPNTNYQVVKKKGSKAYYAEIANSNPPMPDATLPPLES